MVAILFETRATSGKHGKNEKLSSPNTIYLYQISFLHIEYSRSNDLFNKLMETRYMYIHFFPKNQCNEIFLGY